MSIPTRPATPAGATRRRGVCAAAWLAVALAGPAVANGGAHGHHHAHHAPAAAMPAADSARRLVEVTLPAVPVQQHDGRRLPFAQQLDGDAPVLLNFIYTSCTAICPPMTQIFAHTQARLGERARELRMISVSIDPEIDTAAKLSDYAARHGAGAQWRFDTGSVAASQAIQRAFGVYSPDPMGHTPVTFVRPRGAQRWVRLDGFAPPERLIQEAFGGS